MEGFSDIYLMTSRKLLGSYWSTGDRVVVIQSDACFSEFIPGAGGVCIAGAQLGGHYSVSI